MTTLCEECVPERGEFDFEVLSVWPSAPCEQCGREDRRMEEEGGLRCLVFRKDPRIPNGLQQHALPSQGHDS